MRRFDSLGDRMKDYESVSKNFLMKRTPVIIRLDMRAGHTFTKGFKRPFDDVFMNSMQETMKQVCENIPGCVLGYTQSDEISLLLLDWNTLDTAAWFNNNVQKLASISASMATLYFMKNFDSNVEEYIAWFWDRRVDPCDIRDEEKYIKRLEISNENGTTFDSRAFNLQREEVTNYFLWRQNDATRNSIEATGQAHFTHSELYKKTCNDIQDMLLAERGIDWNEFPTVRKRGCCYIKKEQGENERKKWEMDYEIPIFKNEGRDYIERLLVLPEQLKK